MRIIAFVGSPVEDNEKDVRCCVSDEYSDLLFDVLVKLLVSGTVLFKL